MTLHHIALHCLTAPPPLPSPGAVTYKELPGSIKIETPLDLLMPPKSPIELSPASILSTAIDLEKTPVTSTAGSVADIGSMFSDDDMGMSKSVKGLNADLIIYRLIIKSMGHICF